MEGQIIKYTLEIKDDRGITRYQTYTNPTLGSILDCILDSEVGTGIVIQKIVADPVYAKEKTIITEQGQRIVFDNDGFIKSSQERIE